MNLISLERLKKALESFYDRISGIFATKSEMTTGLNKKSDTGHSHNNATVTSNGYMSKDDKAKLDGIANSANNYTHPSKHAASMITQDATHRFVTDTEKSTWNAKASTSVATTSANGLMSSSDKTKLDGIAEGAQVNADITKAEIEAKLTGAITSHTHKYAGSSSAGGAATSANKVNKNITVKLNSGKTEGTDLFTFNGSAAKTINITPANIGAVDFESLSQMMDTILTESTFKDSFSLIESESSDANKYFNFVSITTNREGVESKEFWILINARYDKETKRFKRINIDNFSFGWQMQASGTYPGEESFGDHINQGINLWKANGRKAFLNDPVMYNSVTEDIGVEVDGKWYEFGYMLGWNNHFMNDSYGGMTIGGDGFEIDGAGLHPYSRISHSKYRGASRVHDNIEDYEFAYTGVIENSFHGLTGKDDYNKKGLFFGFKSEIETFGDLENYARTFTDQETTYFTIMEHPAGAEDVFEEWEERYRFYLDGNIGITPTSVEFVLSGEILNNTDYQVLFTSDIPINQNNIIIKRILLLREDGSTVSKFVENSDITLSEYGIYGYAGLDETGVPYKAVKLYCKSTDISDAVQLSNSITGDNVKITNEGVIELNASNGVRINGESIQALGLQLGETDNTAFRGDYGAVAYEHAQAAHAPSNAQKNSDITKAEIEAKLKGTITSHTHKYAGSSSAGGAATSANKLATARDITIGNKTNSFNGTAAITYTLADIGAANASEVVLKGDSLENIETNLENLLAENGLYQGDDITTIDYTLESTFSNKIGALSNLNTTTQTSIVDAINEVFQSGNNVKGNLVDALVAKGMDVSTSESWDNIIAAVRDFSGGLNVIAASSLPSNGSENQICVITDNPTTNIVVTHNDTFTASGDAIVVYLRDHVDYLTPISITSGGVTNDYYIDYVLQNGTSCEAYVYQSGNWNKVAGKCTFLLKNGTAKDITWNTTVGTYCRYMAGTGVYLSTYGSTGYYTYFTTGDTLTKNYSKARIKGVYTRGSSSYNYKLYVGGRTSSAASYSTSNYATYGVNTTLKGTGQTYASNMIDMEIDISSVSLSNNYFLVQLYAVYSTQMGVTITDIILVE